MEEEKKPSLLRRFARFLTVHKKAVYVTTACTVAGYLAYKLYSRCTPVSEFTKALEKDHDVSHVFILGVTLAFQRTDSKQWFLTERGMYDDNALLKMLEKSGTTWSCSPIADSTPLIVFVNVVLPIYLMIWAMKKFIMPDTKPLDNRIDCQPVRFYDIGGNENAKEQLLEIVDYIKNPEKYKALGIRLPRGVMLYGAPGTGKTMMARALATECGVPFKYANGSDFVELYAGLGPKRVRELFQSARELGKCIIFIDEIDSLGGERGRGNACKEFDNTLNQLLAEMDGFLDSSGITVIAATNRENHIDEALLRPGRFDRKIKIELPNFEARRAILTVHLGKRNSFVTNEELTFLVSETEGLSGAELENIINESSFLALKRWKTANREESKEELKNNDLLKSCINFKDLKLGLKKVKSEKIKPAQVDAPSFEPLLKRLLESQKPADVINK